MDLNPQGEHWAVRINARGCRLNMEVIEGWNGARGKRCDIDGKAEGRERGKLRVNAERPAVRCIAWLDGWCAM